MWMKLLLSIIVSVMLSGCSTIVMGATSLGQSLNVTKLQVDIGATTKEQIVYKLGNPDIEDEYFTDTGDVETVLTYDYFMSMKSLELTICNQEGLCITKVIPNGQDTKYCFVFRGGVLYGH